MASKNGESSRKRKAEVAFKEGKPGDRELDKLAGKIGSKWEQLGRHFDISQNVLEEIATNEKDKPLQMLFRWRRTTDSATPYRDLYYGLRDERVGLNDVAEEFCIVEMSPKAIKAPKTDSKKQKTQAKVSKPTKKGARRTPAREAKNKKKAEAPGVSQETDAPRTDKEEEKAKLKEGIPSKNELEDIASKMDGDSWKKLARRLNIEDPKITDIGKAYDNLSEKAYQMLLRWTQAEGSAATYKVLFEALNNDKVDRRDLAEKYCVKKD